MNPTALMANIGDLPRGGDLIVNTDEFTRRNLTKVGYEGNPLDDGSLEQYHLYAMLITSMDPDGDARVLVLGWGSPVARATGT